jgi:MFS family permease
VLLDVSPLRRHRDFRLLFAGQFVSGFGTFFTYVALPWQIFEITKSSALVGLLGAVQLVPLAIAALWGGAYADAIDRRRLLLCCEMLMLIGSLALALNSLADEPSVIVLFAGAAFMSAVNGFHRPALEAMTPKLVSVPELPAASALSALRRTVSAVAGPALAGVCIAAFGLPFTYGVPSSSAPTSSTSSR